MKTAEIRGMSDEQLALTIKDREKELFDLRFQSATNRLEAHAKIKQARRDLARLLTIQHAVSYTHLTLPTTERV